MNFSCTYRLFTSWKLSNIFPKSNIYVCIYICYISVLYVCVCFIYFLTMHKQNWSLCIFRCGFSQLSIIFGIMHVAACSRHSFFFYYCMCYIMWPKQETILILKKLYLVFLWKLVWIFLQCIFSYMLLVYIRDVSER